MYGVPVEMQPADKWILEYESHASKMSKGMTMYWKGKEQCVLTKRGGTFGWFIHFEDEDITMGVDTMDLFFEPKVNPWTVPLEDLSHSIDVKNKQGEEKMVTTVKEKKPVTTKRSQPVRKDKDIKIKKAESNKIVQTTQSSFSCQYECGFTSTSSQGLGAHHSTQHKKDGYISRADARDSKGTNGKVNGKVNTKIDVSTIDNNKSILKNIKKENSITPNYWKIKYETVLEVIKVMKLHGDMECKKRIKN